MRLAAPPAGEATSSRRRRWGRCSARSSPVHWTTGGGNGASPIRSWSSRRAPGAGTLADRRPRPRRRRARRRSGTCSSSGRRRYGRARPSTCSLEDPALAFAPDRAEDEDGDVHPPEVATGPIVVSLDSLPRLHGSSVVIANELLDNLPVDLLERRDGDWFEVRVGLDGDELVEKLVPARRAGPRRTRRRAGAGPDGRRPLGARRPRAAGPWSRSTTPTRRPRWRSVSPARVAAHLPRPPARRTAAPGPRERRTSRVRSPSTSCRRRRA